MNWQQIETAPKDGTAVLLTNGKRFAIGLWRGERPFLRWENGWGVEIPGPTHWMPLPAPPEEPA